MLISAYLDYNKEVVQVSLTKSTKESSDTEAERYVPRWDKNLIHDFQRRNKDERVSFLSLNEFRLDMTGLVLQEPLGQADWEADVIFPSLWSRYDYSEFKACPCIFVKVVVMVPNNGRGRRITYYLLSPSKRGTWWKPFAVLCLLNPILSRPLLAVFQPQQRDCT